MTNPFKPKEVLNAEVKLIIPDKTWQTIMGYTKTAVGEISGFFDVDYDPTLNALVAGEVYLLDQEAGGAEVEISEDTMQNFLLEMIKAGKDQMPRGWWHSHVDMGTFFSNIDENTIKNMRSDSYSVALVVNKQGFAYSKLDMVKPFPLQVESVTIEIDGVEAVDLKSIEAEVVSKVKTKTYNDDYWRKDWTKGTDGGWTQKKKSKGFNQLPKDKLEALTKIYLFKLDRIFNDVKNEWVYQDPLTGDIWQDTWNTVSDEDYWDLVRGKYDITDIYD